MKALTSIIAGALALAFTTATAAAQTTLRVGHGLGTDHPVHLSLEHMAKIVQERTNGDVRIRVFPSGQLGQNREMIEQVQAGALDMVQASAGALEAFVPELGVFNLPYLFRSREHFFKVLEGDVGSQFLRVGEKKNLIGLAYFDSGSRNFYASRAVNSPADLKGMKIRIQPSPTTVRMIELLGASPTPLSWGETYPALQSKIVDGAENNVTALTLGRHGEVAKFFTWNEHTMVPDLLMIGSDAWAKLNEKQRTVLAQAGREAMAMHKDLWAKATEKAISDAKGLGVTFIQPEKAAFMQAVAPLREDFKKRAELAAWIDRINAVQ